MKALKAICTAAILALALSVPTYAGEILTPGVTGPPPPPPACTASVASTSPGDVETPGLVELLLAILSIF